jgi:hypothetical protein
LHLDTGELGGGNAVPELGRHDEFGSFVVNRYQWAPFDAIKSANFAAEREEIFHYALFVHDIKRGSPFFGASKCTPGRDLLVGTGTHTDPIIVGGTFLHELGHNLGLKHGGKDDVNWKPNYLSVMNYIFQVKGIWNGTDRVLDYSRKALPTLKEGSLNEITPFQPGDLGGYANYSTTYFCGEQPGEAPLNGSIDWDCDGTLSPKTRTSINNDKRFGTLSSYDDWSNLKLAEGLRRVQVCELIKTILGAPTNPLEEADEDNDD